MARRAKGEGTIYQDKAGKWRGEVTIGTSPTGRPIRKQTTRCDTKQEAATALAELRKQYHQDSDLTKTGKFTVATYITHWLETAIAPPNCRRSTYTAYEQCLRLYMTPTLGHIRLDRLSTMNVQRWLTELRKTKGERTKRPLSDWTVRHTFQYLNEALDKAVQWGVITRNPCDGVDKPPMGKTNVDPLTIEEARALLTQLQGHRLEHYFRLMLPIGLRRGESLALRWSDYNAKTGELKIQRKAIRHHGKEQTIVTEPLKTSAGNRTIRLPATLQEVLSDQWERLQEDRKQDAWREHGLIFPSSVGTYLEATRVNQALTEALAKAGLRHVTVHQLRHSAASLLLAQGVSLADVSRILGHSSPAITAQLYAHGYADKQPDQIGRVSDLLAVKDGKRKEAK